MKRIPVYLSDEAHEALRTKAFYERTSINKLVLAAVDDLLRKGPRKLAAAPTKNAQRSKATRKEKKR